MLTLLLYQTTKHKEIDFLFINVNINCAHEKAVLKITKLRRSSGKNQM